jgi:glycosyl hydrolase family 76
MPTDYLPAAKAAAKLLTTRWFTVDTPGNWVPDDYWKCPTIASELVTHMRLAGTRDHLDVCDATRDAGTDYLTDSAYLDDATCWGRLGTDAYAWLAPLSSADAASYLEMARTVGDDLQGQWDATSGTCGGGLFWMRDPGAEGNFKASNSTLGLMEIALGLYAAEHDKAARLTWARRCWGWLDAKQLIDKQGLVWGALTSSCTVDPGNIPVVALQGNPLGPLWTLYEATGDDTLLDAAQLILDKTLASFTWPGTPILCTPQDGAWSREDDGWRQNNLNPAMFKGICAGYAGPFVARLATVRGREPVALRYTQALRTNADALLANYPHGIYGMDWHTPDPSYKGDADDTINAALQFGGLAALDAAVAVAGVT